MTGLFLYNNRYNNSTCYNNNDNNDSIKEDKRVKELEMKYTTLNEQHCSLNESYYTLQQFNHQLLQKLMIYLDPETTKGNHIE